MEWGGARSSIRHCSGNIEPELVVVERIVNATGSDGGSDGWSVME
jgi:hypothetical protein